MVNVNISEEGWKFVKGYAKPGESFAQTFDRILRDCARGLNDKEEKK